MNRATKIIELPALTVDLLKANGVLIDNIFVRLWQEVGMKTILSRAGFNKRSGTSMSDVIFGLMLLLWLTKESIGMFARECLQGAMGKDVLYDTMNREDLNWRKFHEQIAHKTVQTFKASGKKAYVVDDSVKQRFGKKRAKQSLCSLYRVYPFNGNPVLFIDDRQTDTRDCEFRIDATEAMQQQC